MKIYSYLKHLRTKRQQFEYDKWKLLFSLKFRPRNWYARVHFDGRIYQLTNQTEKMIVWIANAEWGLYFNIEDRKYGGVNIWGNYIPWRREVLKHGIRASQSSLINKEGFVNK